MSIMTAEPASTIPRAGGYCKAHPEAPLTLLKRFDRFRIAPMGEEPRLRLVLEASVCELCSELKPSKTRKFKFEIWLFKEGKQIAQYEQGFYTPNQGRNYLWKWEKSFHMGSPYLKAFEFQRDDTLIKLIIQARDELLELADRYWVDQDDYENEFD